MKKKSGTILIFLVIIASSFYFGFSRLKNFSGVDEPYWSYGRVPNFWTAVAKHKWKNTNICDKPGIPLAIVSGAGLPFIGENPKSYKSIRYEPKTPEQLQKIGDIYFFLRLPVFLFTLAMLPVFYFFIKKLLGRTTARFSLIFMGLSPILLGISLIINSDAMLWILTALSTLSLFVFLEKSEKKYLVFSGFFLGLSVIDKYVANILFVYFFLIFFLEYIFRVRGKTEIGKYLRRAFLNYLLLVAAALLTAFAFFPATWVKSTALFNATFGNDVFSSTWPLFVGIIAVLAVDIFVFRAKLSNWVFGFLTNYRKLIAKIVGGIFLLFAVFLFLHVYLGIRIFDLQATIASPKGIGDGSTLFRYVRAISADMFSLFFSISPLALVLAILAAASLFLKREVKREMITVVYIFIFIFIFYLGSAVNEVVTTVRYQIMVYPLIFVVAAIGASQFLEFEKVKKYVSQPVFYLGTIAILIASLQIASPHYLAYASEILPKSLIVNLKGMGEGSIEAAEWLNQQPNAHDMVVWSDKGAVCERFVGRCYIDFKKKTFEQNDIRYFVLSTDRRSRSLKMSKSIKSLVDFSQMYAAENSVFEVVIDNNPNNFVRIFKASDYLHKNQ
ncbi:MAG: glycosyltransferase family 39 protein [Candidatus Moranbacteria bacterium]|nr:glycosyltransferase family 39 protein [Candidatus Moranbacteria bacterium]